jgi:adenosylcobinamide-phosphate synthase
MSGGLILASAVLDWAIGDPEWLPHPVRLMGRAITAGERILYRPGKTPARNFLAGAFLASGLVTLCWGFTRFLVRTARGLHPAFGTITEVGLAATCLASRNLYDEASFVFSALDADDLPRSRARLARIVGRDTQALSEDEICRAVIETLAESTCDGIVAPLFYLAIGGVPLAMAFKAISTLDSMIGDTSERYLHFGRFAARLDDAANFIPARLAALGIVAASGLLPQASAVSAARTWIDDGHKHKSPNAGQPEAAMAGALCVRLGGANTYAGERITAPELGSRFSSPTRASARLALRIMILTSAAATLAAMTLERRTNR